MDTREQKLAKAIDRHLVIKANAGSGKTRILVDRYVDLVLHKADPKEVVAITFTKKAAAEMKSRVAEKLEGIASAKDGKYRKRIKILREKLTNARISTIHSFCSSLLRDYPVEAGLEPDFTDISQADSANIEKNAIDGVMEKWMDSEDDDVREKIFMLTNLIGKNNIDKYIRMILNKISFLDKLKDLYKDKNKYIDHCNEYAEREYGSLISDFNKNYLFILKEIDPGLINQKYHEGVLNAVKIFTELTNKAKLSKEDYSIIAEMTYDGLFTLSCTLRDDVIKNIKDEVKNELKFVNGHGKFVNRLSKAVLNEESIGGMFDLSEIIFELAVEVYENIDTEKNNYNVVDYNDMLLKARNILKNEFVRNKLRDKIKYILVDEFQDTSPVQYDIIESLSGLTDDENPTNLFIVGDGKQSIYGFRNADIRVFLKAKDNIKEANEKSLAKGLIDSRLNLANESVVTDNPNEKLGDILLDATFRLSPVIAAFINMVGEKIFSENQSEFDVNYSDFICAKESGTASRLNKDIEIDNDGTIITKEKIVSNFGTVKLIAGGEDDNAEENIVASYIDHIVNSDKDIKISTKSGMRKPEYKDICILSRKIKSFEKLTEKLLEKDIPFVRHSGTGFYSAQEIRDFINFLKFISNPKDNIAFASLLKSTFFSISDTELLKISSLDGNYLYDKFIKIAEQAGCSTDILYACEVLGDLLSIAPRLSVSQLLLKFAELTAWHGRIKIFNSDIQLKSNFLKLVDYARDFESRGMRNLQDFLEEMQIMMEGGIKESEAAFISGENAVNLMTIHSAKGLEFPIVIILDINSKAGWNPAAFINEEFGLTFKMPVINNKGYSEISEETLPSLISNENIKSADAAELKRLLYVAMSRAEQHLVLSLTLNNKKNGFWKLINRFSEFDNSDKWDENTFIKFQRTLKFLHEGTKFEKNISFPIEIIRLPYKFSNIKKQNGVDVEVKINLENLTGEVKDENFSSSKLMAFGSDREEYRMLYRLGFDIAELDSKYDYDIGHDKNIREIALAEGLILHSVMENISEWIDDDFEVQNDALNSIMENSLIQNNISIKTDNKKIRLECLNIVNDKFIHSRLKNLIISEKEKELHMPVGNDFIVAVIDVLYKNDNDEYEIWDWKTNNVKNEKDVLEHAKKYELQMKIYAYFLSLLYPGQKEYKARLIFSKLACKNLEKRFHKFCWNKVQLSKYGDELNKKIKELKDYIYK